MLLSDLEKLVRELRGSDEIIVEQNPDLPGNSDPDGIIYANNPNHSVYRRRFYGGDEHGDICPENYDAYTDICTNTPHRKRAVVAVIDDLHKNGPNIDLQVIVACGINYGQQGRSNYCATPIGIYDSTGMRPGLKKAFEVASNNKKCPCSSSAIPQNNDYYLLAVNLFPWMTRNSWRDCRLDAIDESLMVGSLGFGRPFYLLERICNNLGEGDWLIFHGSRNCVAPFGMSFVLQKNVGKLGVMFCRNLINKLQKAVILCQTPNTRENLEAENSDE